MNPGSPGSQDDYLKCNSDSWSLGPLEPLQMHAFRLGAPQSLPNPGFLVGHRSPRGQSPQQLVWLLPLLPVCDSMTLSEPQSLSWLLPLALTLSLGLLLLLILESVAQPEPWCRSHWQLSFEPKTRWSLAPLTTLSEGCSLTGAMRSCCP